MVTVTWLILGGILLGIGWFCSLIGPTLGHSISVNLLDAVTAVVAEGAEEDEEVVDGDRL